ncbi:glycogen debranching protein [Halalkalicoccus paucihalophilus]|nr:glycogen debranching protein [Halalkalicoccus paucihalophilus]
MQGATTMGLIGATGLASGDTKRSNTQVVEGAPESPTLSITERLEDRRYVTSGTRAYIAGIQTGRFPAMGWHIGGEMEGVWSPPLKLLDGIWFEVNGESVGPATEFTRGYGFVKMDLPTSSGISLERTEFVPDDERVALIGLHFTAEENTTIEIAAEAHSELTTAYPWSDTDPSQTEFNLEDEGEFDGERLVFRSGGTPPIENAGQRDWAAAVGATLEPVGGEAGEDFRGPQDEWETYDPNAGEDEDAELADGSKFERHDNSVFGRGTGGRLEYELEVSAGETQTIWFAVAGSESGADPAIEACEAALSDPEEALSVKIEERLERYERTRLNLPGNRRLEEAIDWTKQNLSDLVQESRDLQIRVTNAGENYPEPSGTVDRARFVGAGYPDFPWLFAVDGEYTTFASVALGQFEPIKEHMRALYEISEVANEGSGKVVHEVITDGSVYYGANDDPGNTDETAKFPSAVATIWRWSGDDAFRDELYDFARRNMEYLLAEFGGDEGWPVGEGNVEREGMGERVIDNAVYTIRGLYDLADMAVSKGDDETVAWATERADEMLDEFNQTWWVPEAPSYADSLDDEDDTPLYHRHWIGLTPFEIQLPEFGDDDRELGITGDVDADSALSLRETECFGGIGSPEDDLEGEWNIGLYHTGAPGCEREEYDYSEDHTERNIYTLNTAIMAISEGNYGRLGNDKQGRFIDANASLQLPEPDEIPGAMPEVVPSPEYGRSINQPFTDRLMALQAWGSYGTVWPVVGQQLGVRPDMGRGRLEITPQVPPKESQIGAENVRVGDGSIDVQAQAGDGTYSTTVCADADVSLKHLIVGHTIPEDIEIVSVALDGEDADCEVRKTNRGWEVVTEADPDGERTLVVETSR